MQNLPGIQRPVIRSVEEIKGRNDPEAIKAVAKEMESLFAYEMIKAMRETSGLFAKGGLGKDTYMSMFDLELSKLFAERGLGLQDMFVKQLTMTLEKSGSTPDAGKDGTETSIEPHVHFEAPFQGNKAAPETVLKKG